MAKTKSKPIESSFIDPGDFTKTQGSYPSDDDLEFVSKVLGWWDEADAAENDNLESEKSDHAFAVGHQWDAVDIAELKKTKRVPLVINKVRPTIQVVGGHERANRMRVRYLPVERSDTFKAEVWSEVARMVQENGDIDFQKSDAFADMLRGGRGFLELRAEFSDNPAGEIVGSRVLPWELRIDPTSNDYYLRDARYLMRAKDVSFEVLLTLWPEKEDEILSAQSDVLSLGESGGIAERENKYEGALSKGYQKSKGTWQLIEAWYWQVEKTSEYRAKRPGGQWEPIVDQESMDALLIMMPGIEHEESPRYERVYYQAFVCGPVLLENNPSPYEYKGFPFVPILGEKDSETGRYLGMVHAMRDPQMELNKRRTQILHIINKAAKSGWYGPKGAFVDRDQWEEESAAPGVILEYDVSEGQKEPQVINPPAVPQAFITLEQMASVDIRDVSGVNIELMGLSQKDTPGIVTSQRQKQALTILQNYFDSLRRSTKHMGRILLSMMQQYYTDGRQYQIPGLANEQGQPVEQVQLNKDMKLGRYDLIAEEAPYSPNQKMETAAKLMSVIEIALKAGLPVPPDAIDYLDLPEAFTDKWKKLMQTKSEKQEPPDPKLIEVQGKQEELQRRFALDVEKHRVEMQQMVANIKKTESETIKNIALAEAAEIGPQLEQYKLQMADLGRNIEHQQRVYQQNQEQQGKAMQAEQEHQQQMMQADQQHRQALLQAQQAADLQGQAISQE
jgi:hypothetical protein